MASRLYDFFVLNDPVIKSIEIFFAHEHNQNDYKKRENIMIQQGDFLHTIETDKL